MNKARVVEQTRKLVMARWPTLIHSNGACLYMTYGLMFVLTEMGKRPILQAGSCDWPRLTPEQDDGIAPNFYGFVWEPDSLDTFAWLLSNTLPEMHVWCGLPEDNEIIDLTCGTFPLHCRKTLGLDWPGHQPPDYLWCKCNEVPRGVTYIADERAMDVAYAFIRKLEGM